MTQYGFHFDGTRCTGCKTCMLACKDYHNLSNDVAFRQIYEYGLGEWTQDGNAWTCTTSVYYISEACNHCDSPMCFASCAQNAIIKDEDTGIVYIDAEKCIDCGACAEACPYSIPKRDAENSVYVKCDGCKDRVAEGKQPICVEACPLRALDFGDIEELRSSYGDVASVAPLADPSLTSPNLVITEPKNALPFNDATGTVLNQVELV